MLFPIRTAKIVKVIEENYKTKTFELEAEFETEKPKKKTSSRARNTGSEIPNASPGQFIMVWLPGIGERPMGIESPKPLTISVANAGKVTAEMHKLKEGDMVSFKGPLGKGFDISKLKKGGKILIVAGGTGVVPLYFLATYANENGLEPYVILGARSAKEHTFKKRMTATSKEVFITTDDGTEGRKGNVVDEMRFLIDEKKMKFDAVYSCGPERMMRAVGELCVQKKIPCQLSLERYMKCGIGVCGSCDLDGLCICKEGPVFEATRVLCLQSFGKKKRDATGKEIDL